MHPAVRIASPPIPNKASMMQRRVYPKLLASILTKTVLICPSALVSHKAQGENFGAVFLPCWLSRLGCVRPPAFLDVFLHHLGAIWAQKVLMELCSKKDLEYTSCYWLFRLPNHFWAQNLELKELKLHGWTVRFYFFNQALLLFVLHVKFEFKLYSFNSISANKFIRTKKLSFNSSGGFNSIINNYYNRDISNIYRSSTYLNEENIWKFSKFLLDKNDQSDLYAVFISNKNRMVPIWCQKAANDIKNPVIWDYHVIAIQRSIDKTNVYDFDTVLNFPESFESYVKKSFPLIVNLNPKYERLYRVIPAKYYVENFASDRSHMIDKNTGKFIAEPPNYGCIRTEMCTNNIEEFIDMNLEPSEVELFMKKFNDTFE
ncbi:N-terminal glutamine amidohydrolase [Brachionus plicatilis]|uniref:Protein N-terminal glutamine amidohydrolase n=1 Tax=Brachionus plicatilis TaxID=10195 RepID=A0A3M7SMH4_BRAPC|nr:N-terminal glutamine amidohydrolase [Brachionus plicatilis]